VVGNKSCMKSPLAMSPNVLGSSYVILLCVRVFMCKDKGGGRTFCPLKITRLNDQYEPMSGGCVFVGENGAIEIRSS